MDHDQIQELEGQCVDIALREQEIIDKDVEFTKAMDGVNENIEKTEKELRKLK